MYTPSVPTICHYPKLFIFLFSVFVSFSAWQKSSLALNWFTLRQHPHSSCASQICWASLPVAYRSPCHNKLITLCNGNSRFPPLPTPPPAVLYHDIIHMLHSLGWLASKKRLLDAFRTYITWFSLLISYSYFPSRASSLSAGSLEMAMWFGRTIWTMFAYDVGSEHPGKAFQS